jgi:hypothetical protein
MKREQKLQVQKPKPIRDSLNQQAVAYGIKDVGLQLL